MDKPMATNKQQTKGGLRELALFAGAGGGVLAGKLLGWRTICAVEQNRYAASVLVSRQNDGTIEPFPIWDDVSTFDGTIFRGRVDVISGGFPCQDISVNGDGKGISGERSGLWKEMARIICEVEPRFVFVENSPMLTSRGLGVVLGDLAEMGFDAEWGCLSAADCGAPHKRERIWIVAHANGERLQGDVCWEQVWTAKGPVRPVEPGQVHGWFDIPEPYGVRSLNGVAHGVERLRAIGNGQVPIVAATSWKILGGEH